MFETLKRWNQERKLSPHEQFVARAGRRIVENRRRERAGLPTIGLIIRSEEPVRTYVPPTCPTNIIVSTTEEPSEEVKKWAESFKRIDSPGSVTGFEQVDDTGQILGRIWVHVATEVDFVEE